MMSITVVLIVITCVVSFSAWKRPELLQGLIYHGPSVARGEYWRLLTYGFIHSDGNHLLFNMVTLYFFGEFIEGKLASGVGALGYVVFYLAGLVLAILPSHMRHRRDNNYRSLGASGAVSAVLFAYILMRPWSMLFVMFIPVPAVVFAALYMAYSIWAEKQKTGKKINHSAHLWGAAWGVVFFLAIQPDLLPAFFDQLLDPPFLR